MRSISAAFPLQATGTAVVNEAECRFVQIWLWFATAGVGKLCHTVTWLHQFIWFQAFSSENYLQTQTG